MIRFGIIGTGKISHTFMNAALKIPDFKLEAVYSRSEEKGGAFAAAYGIYKVYTSLKDMEDDSSIDAVYIASPNSCHCSQAISMARSGKHILCEKPIASSLEELESMIEAAHMKERILLEAMRSVHDPGFAKIKELLPKLGQVRRAVFQYCQYSSRYDSFKEGIIENAFNPIFSNAALMDIGVYCVHPMVHLFGRPQSITASSVFLDNHMEGIGTVIMNYGNMLGEVRYSKITDSAEPSEIQGENATMLIWQIQDTKKIELKYRNGDKEIYEIAKEDNNMYYEILRFIELVKSDQGLEESKEYLKDSVLAMEIMDQVRDITGISFTG